MKKIYSVTMSFSATIDIGAKSESDALDQAEEILGSRGVYESGSKDERFDNTSCDIVGMETCDEET